MTHRAEQIVEAMASQIAAFVGLSVNSNNVFIHRVLTLDEVADELDAIAVNYGEDVPIGGEGFENLAYIDSRLSVFTVAYCKGDDEFDLRRALLNLRRQIHQALMADDTLGLSFVTAVRYAGASEPEIDATTGAFTGKYQSRWDVDYRMNFTDPG